MPINRSQMLKVLKAINEPKLIHEEDYAKDRGLRVFTREGGYPSVSFSQVFTSPHRKYQQ